MNTQSPVLSQDEKILTHDNELLQYSLHIALSNPRELAAIGGCRVMAYTDDAAAASDALALARAMSNKARIHDLPHGGAKAVINLKSGDVDREKVFIDFAHQLNKLCGAYVTAVDVGSTPVDMDTVKQYSPYVLCTSEQPYAAECTAFGVYHAMRASSEHYLSKSLNALKISVQGIGAVGLQLIKFLRTHTKQIVVCDVDKAKIDECLRLYPDVKVVSPDAIYHEKTDIFSPCALGSVINSSTLGDLNTRIVCGAANNQLSTQNMDAFLSERGIVYVPDYLANGGGLIYASSAYRGQDYDYAKSEVASIYDRCLILMQKAAQSGCSLLSCLQQS